MFGIIQFKGIALELVSGDQNHLFDGMILIFKWNIYWKKIYLKSQ